MRSARPLTSAGLAIVDPSAWRSLHDPHAAQVAFAVASKGIILDTTDDVRRQDRLSLDPLHLGGEAMEARRAEPRVELVLGIVDAIEGCADEVVDRRHGLGGGTGQRFVGHRNEPVHMLPV